MRFWVRCGTIAIAIGIGIGIAATFTLAVASHCVGATIDFDTDSDPDPDLDETLRAKEPPKNLRLRASALNKLAAPVTNRAAAPSLTKHLRHGRKVL